MKRIVTVFAAMIVAGAIGCDDNKADKPATDPVTTPAAGEPEGGIEVNAPGVDVEVKEEGVDVKAPGTDVDVDLGN